MNINPGEMNKKIHIFRLTGEKNPNGFREENRETVREPWAKVTRMSGTEKTEAGIPVEETDTRFLIRYSPKKIDRSMFVEYAGEIYNIKYVNNYGDSNEYIEVITSREGVVNGAL